MFSQLLFKFLIAKIGLIIGLTGFLIVQKSPQIIDSLDVNKNYSEKNISRAFQGLPLALKKADLKPQLKSGKNFLGNLSSQNYLVLDEKSEGILLANQENTMRPIGSISKLMSAIVFLKNTPDWNKKIIMQTNDRLEGNNYINEGESATVKDYFNAALVGSSNSAVLSLVRLSGLGSKQFVELMNKEADKIGLNSTQFVEPTGLSADNKSTARDVALLLKQALSIPEIKEAVTTKIYEFKAYDPKGRGQNRKVVSTDQLLFTKLDDENIKIITGGKTGFIEEAGYCFAVEIEDINGNKIIVVVLGSDSEDKRFSEAKFLASWTFKSFVWPGQEISVEK